MEGELPGMSDDADTMIGLQAIAFMGQYGELLDLFCRSTGLDPAALKARISEPELHAAALDFLLQDDAWVQAFAEDACLGISRIVALRRQLPGGESPQWT